MKKNKLPKVSVIIPTYNRADRISEAIKSIEDQTYPLEKIEIVLVDDKSTDSTESLVKGLKSKVKIEYLKNEKNMGPAGTRNKGIKKSRGEYVFFTDDDCVASKNWIKDFVTFFQENENVGGIGGPLVPREKNIISKIESFKDLILGIGGKKPEIGRDEIPVGFTSNMAYKKSIFEKSGTFDENYRVAAGEDKELKDRVCKHFDVAYFPSVVWHNQEYDLNYLVNILFKQGLNKKPPKETVLKKVIFLIINSPILAHNIIRKAGRYREGKA